MATSLAPSPMASVVAPLTFSRTSETSCAFCEGAQRQPMTLWQFWVSLSSSSCRFGSSITSEITSPSSTSACFSPVPAATLASSPLRCSSCRTAGSGESVTHCGTGLVVGKRGE